MDSHKCPITCQLFCDPVTGQDGHTYERAAITSWLWKDGTSPMTREPMTIDSLRSNHTVKKIIDEFLSTSLQKHYLFKIDVDIRKTKRDPIFQAPGKTIFEAEWISISGPPIVLLKISGAKANREASFYVQLSDHPHIVHTFGMIQNDGRSLTLVQEYATKGNLSLLLRENDFRPSISVLLEIFLQITDGMICLAKNGIVHGDLACRNVPVFRFNHSRPSENLVKLTDFGLTRTSTLYSVVDSTAATTLIIIPLRYAAPEILQNVIASNYSEESDVYSMGVLMWEACSQGELPYASIDDDNEVRRCKHKGEILSRPDNCDGALWNIIVSCWDQQPQGRPTFKMLQQSLLELKFRSSSSSSGRQTDGKLITQFKTKTSTTTNNNSNTSSLPTSHPIHTAGSTSSLTSLSKATDPSGFSFNQQPTSVATFPQRPKGGSPGDDTKSSLGFSFQPTQGYGSNASFSSTNEPSTNPAPFSFTGQPSTNPLNFSFTSAASAAFDQNSSEQFTDAPSGTFGQNSNKQPFTFNQITANSSVQQPLQTSDQNSKKQPFTFNQTTANPSVQQPLQTSDQNSKKQPFTFNQITANSSVQQPLQASDQNSKKQPFTFNQITANSSVQQPLQTSDQNSKKQPFTFNQITANSSVQQPLQASDQNSKKQPFTFNQITANSSVQQPLQTSDQNSNKQLFTFNQTSTNSSVQQPLQTFDQNSNKQLFTFNQTSTNSPVQQPLQTFDQNSNKQPFTFNQTPTNSSIQQPLQTFTVTSSAYKQEPPNNKPQASLPFTAVNSRRQASSTNEAINFSSNNMPTISKRVSDPPTPISEQPGSLNQEQEESDAPVSLADDSLLAKRFNTILRDSHAVVVDRNDPNSPLYALKSFQDLNLKPDILKGIYNMGFRAPSKIQEITLPQLMGNPPRNIIAQSQSGTGKTAAFSLAIISRIDPSIQSVQALILAPTYELAIQIGSVIEKMAQFLPYIQIAYAVRGTKIIRGQLLTQPIVVGTPGTVEDWCYKRRLIDLSTLSICCVDEADVLIATGGFKQTCVDLVKNLNPNNCQMMLFSAAYSDEVMTVAREIIHNPVVLRLKREKQALQNIRQFYIRCYDAQVKYQAIEKIWSTLDIGQAIIFCQSIATARDLAIRMSNDNHSARELTAALDIEQRADIIKNFREGVFRVLISTNVMARGIDVDDVSLVINYDMPVTTTFEPDYETYLRRIGRCGRFGKLGYALNLIGSEKDFQIMQAIEQYFSHPIDELSIDAISHLEPDQE